MRKSENENIVDNQEGNKSIHMYLREFTCKENEERRGEKEVVIQSLTVNFSTWYCLIPCFHSAGAIKCPAVCRGRPNKSIHIFTARRFEGQL